MEMRMPKHNYLGVSNSTKVKKMSRLHLGNYLTCSERELTRKNYLLSLENRTPEQIAEEEALFVEVKRMEQSERKFKKEREELLRTLAGIESGLPDIVEDDMPAAL